MVGTSYTEFKLKYRKMPVEVFFYKVIIYMKIHPCPQSWICCITKRTLYYIQS